MSLDSYSYTYMPDLQTPRLRLRKLCDARRVS